MTYSVEDMLLLLLSLNKTTYSQFVINHLSYGTVGNLCSRAVDEGLIVEYRNTYQVTDRGKRFIKKCNKDLGKTGINQFIAGLPDAHCTQIEIEDIYIPEKL